MSKTPPPLPVTFPPAPVDYHRGRVRELGEVPWVTIALLTTGRLHAARAILTRKGILSRVDPGDDASTDAGIQVPATEAEWARELIRTAGDLAGPAALAGGFLVASSIASDAARPARSRPLPLPLPAVVSEVGQALHRPQAALSVEAPLRRGAGSSAGYYLALTLLWILLGLVLISVVVILFL